jgi:exonuclease SbcC
MRAIEHDGEQYLLIKRSSESSLVRDPKTGTERYLPNDELTVTGEAPLAVAARSVPEPQRRILTAVHSERLLGLLVELIESMTEHGVEQIVVVSHDEELVGAADDLVAVQKDPTTNRSSVERSATAETLP